MGLSNICFSISKSIALIPFEVSKQGPQHPHLSLAEDGISGEGFCHFGELLCSPGSLPWIHVVKLLLDFLLLTHLMSVELLEQPEEPRKAEENFFLPTVSFFRSKSCGGFPFYSE